MNEKEKDSKADSPAFIAVDLDIDNSDDNVCSGLDWFRSDSCELNELINVIITTDNRTTSQTTTK